MKTFVLFCLLFISLLATETFAATFTVTSSANDGAGSLRTAIASANTTIDSDIIEFAIPASDPNCAGSICTITLTSGELAVNSVSTAGTLLITNATGASNLVISGNNTSRVFYVNFGANVTISGVTVTKGNGSSTTSSGSTGSGSIFNIGGALTLINSTVSSNMATFGGGIAGVLPMIDSEGNTRTVLTSSTGDYRFEVR